MTPIPVGMARTALLGKAIKAKVSRTIKNFLATLGLPYYQISSDHHFLFITQDDFSAEGCFSGKQKLPESCHIISPVAKNVLKALMTFRTLSIASDFRGPALTGYFPTVCNPKGHVPMERSIR
jgi:hypothetical protein